MATSSEDMQENKLTFRKFKDGDYRTRNWQKQIFNEDHSHKCPTYVNRTPPCQGSCPAGEDIRGWLDIVRGIEKPADEVSMQKYAFQRLTDANPFPAIMGRVCPAPCEAGCNRNQVEDTVGINAVEQFIGDYGLENKLTFTPAEQDSGKSVAIIGGGPAGLAAAYQLRRRGHRCTVFDDHTALGGMMRYGIPGYRTPRDVLDGEVQRIIDMGVELRLGVRIGRDVTVEDIQRDYDAILWAIGTHYGRPLPIPGGDASNCLSGVAFLSAFNEGRLQLVSEKVVVVGGGDTSIDVASVARRLGHITKVHEQDRPEWVVLGQTAHDVAASAKREGATVTLISHSPIEKMHAAEHEVKDALREGVNIVGQLEPLEVIRREDGRAVALRVVELEEDGKTRKAGTERDIECDLVVAAIGQKGDLSGLEDMDNGKGLINADKNFQVPGKPGHFVAGDIVRPHLLTTAIGQASIAADSIDRYLKHENAGKRPKVDKHHFDLLNKLREAHLEPEEYTHTQDWGTSDGNYAVHNYEDRSHQEIVPSTKLFLGHFVFTPRIKRHDTPVNRDDVLGNFNERMQGLTEEEAVAEADRCMSCGMCFECDNCIIYCPQDAVHRVKKSERTMGRYVYTDYTRCIGCHICAEVCPTGYIDMALGE